RAVLSWNTPPPTNPFDTPFYGNILDANIQLKSFEPLIFKLHDLGIFNAKIAAPIAEQPVSKAIHPDLVKLAAAYDKAGVPQHRYLYSTISPLIANTQLNADTVKFTGDQIKMTKIDVAKIADILSDFNNYANVTYEELTCIGLNTASDTVS